MNYVCVRPNDCYNYLTEVKRVICDCRNTCTTCALSTKQGCPLLKSILCFFDNDAKIKYEENK